MQVKSEVFSRFGSLVDFSSGEPLGGVEAPTVGADLCVRPSSLSAVYSAGGHVGPPPHKLRQHDNSTHQTLYPRSVGADT